MVDDKFFWHCVKYFIFILFFLFTQNVNANWVIFYKSQIFDAKLLLNSVQQGDQTTDALIVLEFKEKLFSDGVGTYVIFVQHVCGEISPRIIEEKFYRGEEGTSQEMVIEDKPEKFTKYVIKTFPELIKQICI
tara:strand:+ start:42 stop:440 length:399 start_codon:yes stop_codon:yes gene_type:complete